MCRLYYHVCVQEFIYLFLNVLSLKEQLKSDVSLATICIVTEPCMLHADTGLLTNKVDAECGKALVCMCVSVLWYLFKKKCFEHYND